MLTSRTFTTSPVLLALRGAGSPTSHRYHEGLICVPYSEVKLLSAGCFIRRVGVNLELQTHTMLTYGYDAGRVSRCHRACIRVGASELLGHVGRCGENEPRPLGNCGAQESVPLDMRRRAKRCFARVCVCNRTDLVHRIQVGCVRRAEVDEGAGGGRLEGCVRAREGLGCSFDCLGRHRGAVCAPGPPMAIRGG